jgi:uncharacterized RDD family membrane protein YckC
MAKGIDVFIVVILSVFFYPLGIILGAIYLAISDSLQRGQSVGKKFMGFAVVSLEDGSPCSVYQSFVRNLPFILPCLLGIIPFWGWIISLFVMIPFLGLEIYLLYRLDSGNRLGDVMADTSVMATNGPVHIENKVKTSWFEGESTQSQAQ